MLIVSLIGSTGAYAQGWEYVYGNVCTRERGFNGVAQVMACAPVGSGYISVGYKETGCGTGVYDSYIVRTNAGGGAGWEAVVDVQGCGGNDFATSVVEEPNGNGFLVVGTTSEVGCPGPGTTDAYAMMLDCNGNVIWVQTYGTPGINDEARDVTLAQLGSGIPPVPGGFPPLPGDYVIAGSTFSGLPVTQDALLFRITPAGMLVWNSAYNSPGRDFLNAVIESSIPNGWGTVGDIIAAGGTSSFGNGLQGLALRVDGNTGTFVTIPPQSIADHGGPSNEIFNNVTELRQLPFAGDLVFVGFTTVNGPTDIYAVRTSPDPCTMLAQNVVTGAFSNDVDVAYDVCEVQSNYPGGALQGEVALTGEATNGSASTEMFLLTLVPGNLNVAGVAMTYGDITPPGAGTLPDGGRSLADDGSGFILCGYATANFLFDGDPEHYYQVKTNGLGQSGCENPWTPGNQSVTWFPGCWTQPISAPLANMPQQRTSKFIQTPIPVCPRQPCIIKLPNNGNDGGHQGVSGIDPTIEMSALRSYPNPVKRGGSVTLEFTSGTSNPIEVRVTNTLGETIEKLTTENEGGLSRLSFRTEELSAGVYMVEVSDGVKTETVRIVVNE